MSATPGVAKGLSGRRVCARRACADVSVHVEAAGTQRGGRGWPRGRARPQEGRSRRGGRMWRWPAGRSQHSADALQLAPQTRSTVPLRDSASRRHPPRPYTRADLTGRPDRFRLPPRARVCLASALSAVARVRGTPQSPRPAADHPRERRNAGWPERERAVERGPFAEVLATVDDISYNL